MPSDSTPAALPFDQLYRHIIAPCLQIITDLAAKRGDKLAYNDIAAMIALYTLVNESSELAAGEQAITAAWPELAGQTPGFASCAMILQHAELSASDAQDCLNAIETSYQQLCELQILGAHRVLLADAWQIIAQDIAQEAKNESSSNSAQEHVKAHLHDAAVQIITSIDIYEKTREHGIQ